MSVNDGQTGNATVFNAAFVSRTSNTGTSGILALTNAAPASGPSITNLQGTVNDALTDIAGFEARITDIEDNTFTFAGNKTFSGNVVVQGNLTVQGTTTAVDSDNLEVEDKNILINKGGNDASAEGAGVTVQRTGTFGSFVYDSALASLWKVGALGSEREVVVSGVAQTIAGIKTFSANVGISTALNLFDDDADFSIELSAPDTLSASYNLKLPTAQGAADTVLTNDGAGNLSWQAGGGGGGGANQSLSNLTDPTSINQNLIFGAPGTLKIIATGDAEGSDALTIRTGNSSIGSPGTLVITTGSTGVGADGGEIRLLGGNGNTGAGGNATLEAGEGDEGAGGNTFVTGGEGIGGSGGNVFITAGAADGGTAAGDVVLQGGEGTTVPGGNVVFKPSNGTDGNTYFKIDKGTDYSGVVAFFGFNDNFYVGIKGPNNIPADYLITLPGPSPLDGQILQSDENGNLSWIDIPPPTPIDFKRQIINFTDLAASGAAGGLTYAATYNIPSRHILEAAILNVKTLFTGLHTTAVASLTGGNLNILGLNLLLDGDVKTTDQNHKYVPSDTLGIQIDVTGANIGDFTDGELEIILKFKPVDDIPAQVFFNET